MGGDQPVPSGLLRHGIEQVDESSDEPEQRRLQHGDRTAEHGHHDEGQLGLAHVEPDEGPGSRRRPEIIGAGEGRDPVFKQAGDGAEDHAKRYRRFPQRGKENADENGWLLRHRQRWAR
ncbi:hypothetical protein D3C80_1792020 [compost metagenome]